MNQGTPYEQLIAEKLDQVPVPDMADGIWAGIAMQLDAGAGSEAPAKKPSVKFGGKGWYGLIGVAGIVALLWWYYGRLPQRAIPPKALPAPAPVETPAVSPPVAKPPTIRDSGKSSYRPPEKKIVPAAPGEVKKDTVLFHPVPKDSVRRDSSFLQKNRLPLPDVDLYTSPPSSRPPSSPPPLSPPPPKKNRGVKGISSDDYKISARKDSAGTRN